MGSLLITQIILLLEQYNLYIFTSLLLTLIIIKIRK